jgi:phage shock protein A
MIAFPQDASPKRIANPRSARGATHRRIDKRSRARYASVARVCGVLAIVLVVLMAYVVLTSSLTGLSYAVAKAQHVRADLQAETMRLDDRIAALRSDDRLSALAARMNMHEAQQFAVVTLPRLRPAGEDTHVAALPSLAGLLMPAVERPR